MDGSVGSKVWALLGWGSAPSKSSPSKHRRVHVDSAPLLNRVSNNRQRAERLSPRKLFGQIDAGKARDKPLARPADSKYFDQFVEASKVDDISTDLHFDASKVPPEVFKDVCNGAPIDAMHAAAKPDRSCGKSIYAQIRNHYEHPWDPSWLGAARALGEASDLEKAQARVVLERYVARDDLKNAVALLFESVNVNGDAIWVDFQQFNEGLGKGKSLADPELQDLVAVLDTCLQSFVNRRKAGSWDKAYILYPVDAKLKMSA